MKYSKELLSLALEFVRRAKDELGPMFGEEQVYAMFDAFDPTLKNQMLMELMVGHIGNRVRFKCMNHDHYSRIQKKISCIKAVRNLSGLGLKEAKYLVDKATTSDVIVNIEGEFTLEAKRIFRANLQDTGYAVI